MESYDLTGIWLFHPDPVGEGEQNAYDKPAYDDSAWREVRVPSDFDTCLPSLEAYEGGAWYRRTFTLPETWREKRILLHFEGVNTRMKVWVNGHLAGSSEMPFLPIDLEIGDYLTPSMENDLAVWVDNTRLPGEVPGMQRGWRTFGGILREVALQSTDALYLDNLILDTDLDETLEWKVYDHIPVGSYSGISFTFGIGEDKNHTLMYVNPPESLMFWPEFLGGGYHYMKLNGKWLDSNQQVSPFNFHLGIGQIYDSTGAITGFIHNNFNVIIPHSSCTMKNF